MLTQPILAEFTLLFGLLVAAFFAVGPTMYSASVAKKQAKHQTKAQQALAQAQAEAAGRQRAIQQAPISAKQMELVSGAEKIGSLVDKLNEQDREEQEIYYLPTAEPTSPAERINRAIDVFFRK